MMILKKMTNSKKFQRKIENFICDNCGFEVKGNGWTNHCPRCLYSKHVDINPGDRLNTCGGLMKPIKIECKNQKYIVIHKCVKCGFEKKNKISENDSFEEILKISKNNVNCLY